MLKCYLEPKLLFASELHIINREAEKHLMALQMWFGGNVKNIIYGHKKKVSQSFRKHETLKLIR